MGLPSSIGLISIRADEYRFILTDVAEGRFGNAECFVLISERGFEQAFMPNKRDHAQDDLTRLNGRPRSDHCTLQMHVAICTQFSLVPITKKTLRSKLKKIELLPPCINNKHNTVLSNLPSETAHQDRPKAASFSFK
jgi:hypothetical protein